LETGEEGRQGRDEGYEIRDDAETRDEGIGRNLDNSRGHYDFSSCNNIIPADLCMPSLVKQQYGQLMPTANLICDNNTSTYNGQEQRDVRTLLLPR